MDNNRIEENLFVLLPLWIGCIVSLIILGVDNNMGTGAVISICVAIIGVIGSLIVAIFQLKRDGKTIDIINNNTKNTENIYDNTKNTEKMLIGEIKPNIDTIIKNTDNISIIVDEVKYQNRIRNDISNTLNIDKDFFLQGVNTVFDNNAKLNKNISELNQKINKLEQKNLLLVRENEFLKEKNKELKQLIEKEKTIDGLNTSIDKCIPEDEIIL